MKIRNLALATAAISLAASPAIAEAAFERSAAPMEGASAIGNGDDDGDASGTILALLAAAAIIAGIVVAAGGGDDAPTSP
jgi:hypothetical protein